MKRTQSENFIIERGLDIEAMRRYEWFFPNALAYMRVRDEHISRFGFAVCTPEAIATIAQYAPILEVGAGSGYWASELRAAGVDIVATEPSDNPGRDYRGSADWSNPHTPIEKLNAAEAIRKYPERTLLMVWPDYDRCWTCDALAKFDGEHVIYVGEQNGGCTGCEHFHERLNSDFEVVRLVAIPQFYGMHDALFVYQRKGQK